MSSILFQFREPQRKSDKICGVSHLTMDEDLSPSFMKTYRIVLLDIINVRREVLKTMHRQDEYADHLIRAKERELDLEEARTRRT